jgi:hypothetical protein
MLGSMVRSRALRALVALSLLTLLVGCGTGSAPSPPSGVDDLVVPTPSPDPSDFVATVDNPWFPLELGTTWTYDVTDADGAHRLIVTAEAGPEVAGVATTARVSTERDRRTVDLYAQDEDGNVWWFGREGEWRAGADGAEAGLAMPATPRLGDGFRSGYAEGAVEDWVRVVSLDGDRLVTELRSELDGASTTLTYERGTGLVASDRVAGDFRTERLTGVTS